CAVDDLPEAAGPSIATTRTDPLQVAEETGITDRHRTALRQLDLGTGHRTQHAEGHRQTVILCRVDAPARWPRGTVHVQIVAAGFGAHAHGTQVSGDQLEAIALLHTQLPHVVEHRLSAGTA